MTPRSNYLTYIIQRICYWQTSLHIPEVIQEHKEVGIHPDHGMSDSGPADDSIGGGGLNVQCAHQWKSSG